MKYEKINKNYTKTIIISIITIVIIGSVLVLNITKAKYKTTISVPIVSGTVKYTGGNADLNVIAVYQQKDGETCTEDRCYASNENIPEKVYKINKEKSFCSSTGNTISNKDDSIVIEYDSYNGKINVLNLTKKGTKCYLYFDKRNGPSDKTLANLNIYSQGEVSDFDNTACLNNCETITENGLYETIDDFGDTYYFRGTVENNWVKFGNMSSNGNPIWWRIIRINGDGSIRLIYAGNGTSGTSLSESGGRINSTDYAYNSNKNLPKYVGYQYDDTKRGHTSPSTAYTQLKDWFIKNLNEEWNDGNGRIDLNAGFCNDRSSSTSNSTLWSEAELEETGGIESTTFAYYGAYLRLRRSNGRTPTLKCGISMHKNDDYFTYTGSTGIQSITNEKIKGTQSLDYPIGLITADEVEFAGGRNGADNEGYWLYTGYRYWTMSPNSFHGTLSNASVMYVDNHGYLSANEVNGSFSLRPVINLKADTQFTVENEDQSKGTSTNPYIVS